MCRSTEISVSSADDQKHQVCRSPPLLRRASSRSDWLWGERTSRSESLIRSHVSTLCTQQLIWIYCNQSRGLFSSNSTKSVKSNIIKTAGSGSGWQPLKYAWLRSITPSEINENDSDSEKTRLVSVLQKTEYWNCFKYYISDNRRSFSCPGSSCSHREITT